MSASVPDLVFENFQQLEDYLHQLLKQGYQQTGTWDLAQTALHLNDWITFPIDGYPRLPVWQRFPLWVLKVTAGRRQLRKIRTLWGDANFSLHQPTYLWWALCLSPKVDI